MLISKRDQARLLRMLKAADGEGGGGEGESDGLGKMKEAFCGEGTCGSGKLDGVTFADMSPEQEAKAVAALKALDPKWVKLWKETSEKHAKPEDPMTEKIALLDKALSASTKRRMTPDERAHVINTLRAAADAIEPKRKVSAAYTKQEFLKAKKLVDKQTRGLSGPKYTHMTLLSGMLRGLADGDSPESVIAGYDAMKKIRTLRGGPTGAQAYEAAMKLMEQMTGRT